VLVLGDQRKINNDKVTNMKLKYAQNGTSTVEFVMIVPFLLALLFLLISFGFMLYNQAVITNAARTGVRAGIVFSVSGNGLKTSCNPLDPLINTNIYGATEATVLAGAKSTAECSAEKAINNPARLIGFGSTSVAPIIDASTSQCTTTGTIPNVITIWPSCLLKVTITYDYTGILFGNFLGISSTTLAPTLTASSSMYYE
jgi:hypothetical protein